MTDPEKDSIRQKLELLFQEIITVKPDDAHLKSIGAFGSDMSIELWDWSQGVGLYGIWRLFESTDDKRYLNYLLSWYGRHLAESSVKNVNYTAPMLTLVSIAQKLGDNKWDDLIDEFSSWIESSLIRTEMGGFAHTTATRNNENQIWVDTLFMCGLFHAKAGIYRGKRSYIDEIIYQYILHSHFLADHATGLWKHGWHFGEKHHFAGVFWGRGNGWASATGIDLLELTEPGTPSSRFIRQIFLKLCRSLLENQDAGGMWRTVLNNNSSYIESSASAAISYAFLKGRRLGILGSEYENAGMKAVQGIADRINENGELAGVSSGTPVFRTEKEYLDVPICQRSYGQSLAMLALSEALLH